MKPFNNTASPAERARQFIEDQRWLRQPPQGTTYHQLQHVDIELEAQGRFAGTKPEMGPAYPRLPEESPYNMQNAVEPPLGIDVSYVEPCGEPHEIRLGRRDRARWSRDGGSVAGCFSFSSC
jgi:hypothetical protein